MPIEVEQKFRVAGLAQIEQSLAKLNARGREPVIQVDTYFDHPGRDFAGTDEALRLRQVGPRNFITYKGPKLDPVTKTRREIEVELSTGEEAAGKSAELLAALGFTAVGRVRKRRTEWTLGWEEHEVTAALDEIDELGYFVELEVMAEQHDAAQARTCLASLAGRLDLKNNERRSYLELLLERRS